MDRLLGRRRIDTAYEAEHEVTLRLKAARSNLTDSIAEYTKTVKDLLQATDHLRGHDEYLRGNNVKRGRKK